MKRSILVALLVVLSPLSLAGVISGNPTNGLRPVLLAELRQQLTSGRPLIRLGPPSGLHAVLSLDSGRVAVQVADADQILVTFSSSEDEPAPL